MPFESDRQRRFLFAKHPGIARRWVAEAEHEGVSPTKHKRRRRKTERMKKSMDLVDIDKAFNPYRVPFALRPKKLRPKSPVPIRQRVGAGMLAASSLAPVAAAPTLSARAAHEITQVAHHAPLKSGASHGGGAHGPKHELHVPEIEEIRRTRRGVYNASAAPPNRWY